MKENKHGNIAIFVPHIGCPCKCSFCDQRVISGETLAPTPHDVIEKCCNAIELNSDKSLEIAFFGGSFTAIEEKYMVSLLEAASNFVGNGATGIRISTRPDCINEGNLTVLKHYGVSAIELGAQSMVDSVLCLNNRGHSCEQIVMASKLIRANGFELGLQMMTGLYGSSDELDLFSAGELIKLFPDTMRIYPTLTLKNTQLEQNFLRGEYTPPSLENAVALAAKLTAMFEEKGIKVIKVGLHASQDVEEKLIAGPYHQAFRELCQGEIIFNDVTNTLKELPHGEYKISVAVGELSKAIGQKRKNVIRLNELGYDIKFYETESVKPFTITKL